MAGNYSLKQLFTLLSHPCLSKTVWTNDKYYEILTSKSWISLSLLFNHLSKELGKKTLTVYIPSFYCASTLSQISKNTLIIEYKIKEDFTPDIQDCKLKAECNKPDIFICVHYFGKNCFVPEVNDFCSKYDSFLIEDATHVLFPSSKIGGKGDFIIYSPWKSLDLPDGAILQIKKTCRLLLNTEKLYDSILAEISLFNKYPLHKLFKWLFISFFKRFVPANWYKKKNSTYETLYVEPPVKISSFCQRLLFSYSEEQLYEYAAEKREKLLYFNHFFEKKFNIRPLVNENIGFPYFYVGSCDKEMKRKLLDFASKYGDVANEWPDLSKNSSDEVRQLKERLVIFTLNESIKIKDFCMGKSDSIKNSSFYIEKIEEEKYRALFFGSCSFVPLLQSIEYNKAKSMQGWNVEFWKISDNYNKALACFIVLVKRILFIKIRLINGGPVWLNQLSDLSKLEICKSLCEKNVGFFKIFLFSPCLKFSGENLEFINKYGKKFYKDVASTGFIDLTQSLDVLRLNLDTKWRNQLKKAESYGYNIIVTDEEEKLRELLIFHSNDKNMRGYKDSGDDLTAKLIQQKCVKAFYVENFDNKTIGYVFIALHNNSATYYIGWSNKEGYQTNVSKLLLWNVLVYLKNNNYIKFDLGGIDFIHTKSIAEFKMGMGCSFEQKLGMHRIIL